jgi:hypothetical protein
MAEASKSVRKRKRRLTLSKAQAEKEEAEQREGLIEQRQRAQKEEFLKRLSENYGIISISAQEAGVSSRSIERWRKADPDFNDACIEQLKVQRGLVEGKLLQKIDEGDTVAIRFYLRCKGRSADMVPETWVETVMVQGDPDQPLHANIKVDEETREAITDSALTKAMSKAMARTPELFGDSPPEKPKRKPARKGTKKAK